MYLVLRVLCESAELSELQLNAGHLCDCAVCGPAWRVSGSFTNVHVRVGDFRWRFESRH